MLSSPPSPRSTHRPPPPTHCNRGGLRKPTPPWQPCCSWTSPSFTASASRRRPAAPCVFNRRSSGSWKRSATTASTSRRRLPPSAPPSSAKRRTCTGAARDYAWTCRGCSPASATTRARSSSTPLTSPTCTPQGGGLETQVPRKGSSPGVQPAYPRVGWSSEGISGVGLGQPEYLVANSERRAREGPQGDVRRGRPSERHQPDSNHELTWCRGTR